MAETKRPTNPAAEEILDLYFPVLDHGFCSLVDYMGTDTCVEKMARVSYAGGGTRKVNQTRGLIRYLKRHFHSTPFESIELKFHLSMPIFILRQHARHRATSANECSGRYSLLPMLFYTPNEDQFCHQSKSNNQGRAQKTDIKLYKESVAKWNELRKANAELYENLTEADVARELARIDLPLSTYSQLYWKVDLRNLLHYLSLRCDSHAQWEIREYANVMAGMVQKIAPLAFEAWLDYEYCGANFSRMELNALQQLLKAYNTEDGKKIISAPEAKILTAEDMPELPGREIDEFISKLNKKEIPNFELDLSKAKPASFFEEKMMAAVPKVDMNKQKD